GRLKITSTDYGKDIRFTVVSDQAGTTQTGIGSVGGSVSRSFDGVNNYLSLGAIPSILNANQLTIAMWVKSTGDEGKFIRLFGYRDDSAGGNLRDISISMNGVAAANNQELDLNIFDDGSGNQFNYTASNALTA